MHQHKELKVHCPYLVELKLWVIINFDIFIGGLQSPIGLKKGGMQNYTFARTQPQNVPLESGK